MNWKNTPLEHAKIWNSAVGKILKQLDKKDMKIASEIFAEQHEDLIDKLPDEKAAIPMFVAWLVSCYMKDSMPVIPWFIEKHGEKLSSDEKEVLLAAHESFFEAFAVKSCANNKLVLADTNGRDFAIDTAGMPKVKRGMKVLGRIMSKGRGRWFVPGNLGVISQKYYSMILAHRRFMKSWHKLLLGFYTFLVEQQHLGEKTADSHAENALLLTMFLEDRIEIDSFAKVTKKMLKKDFTEFAQGSIQPTPDMRKVCYSLFKFFDYLEWEKDVKNPEAIDFLMQQIEPRHGHWVLK